MLAKSTLRAAISVVVPCLTRPSLRAALDALLDIGASMKITTMIESGPVSPKKIRKTLRFSFPVSTPLKKTIQIHSLVSSVYIGMKTLETMVEELFHRSILCMPSANCSHSSTTKTIPM